MTRTFYRDRFTWLAYLLLAFYGYFLNVLGPITPFLKDELKLSYTVSSLHFTVFAVGILLVGLGGHLLISRIGRRCSLWIGAGGMSLGALVLLAGQNPLVTIGASFLMGLVGSLILAVVPAALSDQHGDLRAVALAEANVISSLVSTSAPLMVGWFALFLGSWRPALGMMALLPIFLYLGLGKEASPATNAAQAESTRVTGQPLPVLFWIYWVAIMLAVSVEFCMIFWSADFLENIMGMSKANAAQAVSLFLAAMVLGRVAASRLLRRFSAANVVTASIVISILGFLVFWKAERVLLGLSGLFITGLGVAGLYPLILALAIDAAKNNTVQASTRAALASGTAILILPLLLGRLADAVGIGSAYAVVMLLQMGVFLIIRIAAGWSPGVGPS